MEGKKSFILYCDIKSTIDKLTNEQAGILFKHIISYVNDENPVSNDIIIDLVFEPIKQALKRDLNKWKSEKQGRSEAGKKGMESRWNKSDNNVITKITNDNTVINDITKITNITDNVSVIDSVIVRDIVKENKIINKFIAPTQIEIENYCKERNNSVDGGRFYNFYKSKGWMVGKNKMKDWKACVITWEKTRKLETKKINDYEL